MIERLWPYAVANRLGALVARAQAPRRTGRATLADDATNPRSGERVAAHAGVVTSTEVWDGPRGRKRLTVEVLVHYDKGNRIMEK